MNLPLSPPKTKFWIKWPGPGEFRGQGKWYEVPPNEYDKYKRTNFVPTHEGDEPPND